MQTLHFCIQSMPEVSKNWLLSAQNIDIMNSICLEVSFEAANNLIKAILGWIVCAILFSHFQNKFTHPICHFLSFHSQQCCLKLQIPGIDVALTIHFESQLLTMPTPHAVATLVVSGITVPLCSPSNSSLTGKANLVLEGASILLNYYLHHELFKTRYPEVLSCVVIISQL